MVITLVFVKCQFSLYCRALFVNLPDHWVGYGLSRVRLHVLASRAELGDLGASFGGKNLGFTQVINTLKFGAGIMPDGME